LQFLFLLFSSIKTVSGDNKRRFAPFHISAAATPEIRTSGGGGIGGPKIIGVGGVARRRRGLLKRVLLCWEECAHCARDR